MPTRKAIFLIRQMPAKSGPPPRWERFKNFGIGISSIITALVIPILGYVFANQGKERETQSKFVELALGILKEPPTAEKEDVRKWATGIVNKYSGVSLNTKTQESLINSVSLPRVSETSVRPPLDSTYIQGIDANHNEALPLTVIPKNAIKFVILKASEGTTFTDPAFPSRWQGAKAAGFIRGAYHYLSYGQDPLEQANRYLKVVALGSGDIPPVLDLERSIKGETPPPDKVRQMAHVWLDTVAKASNSTPIIYTTRSFADEYLDESFGRYRLWISRYSSYSKDMVPRIWTDWFIWQYTDAGSIPGVDGTYDLNRFNGSEDELRKALIP